MGSHTSQNMMSAGEELSIMSPSSTGAVEIMCTWTKGLKKEKGEGRSEEKGREEGARRRSEEKREGKRRRGRREKGRVKS